MTRTIGRTLSAVILALVLGGNAQAGTLYGIDSLSHSLVTIDPSTGAATTVGTLNGAAGGSWRGLTFDDNGTLYGVTTFTDVIGRWRNVIYTIDPNTGDATPFHTFPVSSNVFLTRLALGLAFDSSSGNLLSSFTLFGSSFSLYSIETGTPPTARTEIGPLGIAPVSLTFRNSTLFGLDTAGDQLVTIDTGTGTATADVGVSPSAGAGLAYDSSSDFFYSIATQTDQLLRIDPSTGQTTVVGALGGGNTSVLALAFQPQTTSAVPEPATVSLFFTGLLGLAGTAWRRRRGA